MQNDAARSIIQTNCKKWIDGTVTGVNPTGFLNFKESDNGISVSVGRQYPLGLGYNEAGFSMSDGQRVTIPILQFAVWLYAQENISNQTPQAIINKMKNELNLDDSECDLIFIKKDIALEFQATPITDVQLNNICKQRPFFSMDHHALEKQESSMKFTVEIFLIDAPFNFTKDGGMKTLLQDFFQRQMDPGLNLETVHC